MYAGRAILEGEDREFKAIIFIGRSETFDLTNKTYEVHILHDFEGREFYGKRLTVHLVKYIRDNKKFGNVEQLKAQLEMDKRYAINSEL